MDKKIEKILIIPIPKPIKRKIKYYKYPRDFQTSQPETVPAIISKIISINGYLLVRSTRGSVNVSKCSINPLFIAAPL